MEYTIWTKVHIFTQNAGQGFCTPKVNYKEHGIEFIIEKEGSYGSRSYLHIFLPYQNIDYIEIEKFKERKTKRK